MNKIPKLRFPEFSGEWEEKELEKVCNIYDGTHQTPVYVDQGVKFVSVENINDIENTDKYITEEAFEKDFKIKPQKDDILMTRITAGIIGATAIIKNNDPLGYYVSLALLRKKEGVLAEFLAQYINGIQFKKELNKRIIHVAFPKKINLGDIGECKVKITSLPEQEKIASFLSEVDKSIEALEQEKELWEQYKKGMMQKIFSQKIRFKDENGNDYPEWFNTQFNEILKEANEKTTFNNQYNVLSSTKEGIFLQSEYFNREIASSDNTGYKIIRKSQLVFSPQNLWLGNINLNQKYDIGIVSPSYKIFNLNQKIIIEDYLKNILKSNKMLYEYELASEKGASIVRRNLNMDLFMGITIKLPSLPEQDKIADFLSAIDEKIETIVQELESSREFKKGLLQQMFV